MNNRNILQLMDFAAPYRGNFIASIEKIAEYWKTYGSVVFLMPDVVKDVSWVQEFKTRYKVYFISRVFFSRKVLWKNVLYLNDIVKEENVGLICTHFVFYNYSLLLWKKIYGRGIKIIGHFRGEYAYKGKPYMRIVKRWVDNHLYDTIIGVSDFVSDGVRKAALKLPHITTIYNGIDFSRLEKYDKTFEFNRHNFKYVVMMFGWPYRVKGVDIAIRAIQKINRNNSEFLLAVGYCGSREDLKKEIIADIGYIPDFISILPPIDDVATYYNAADVFLSASRTEGFSNAMVESSYSNPYVITSDIPAPLSLQIPHVGIYPVENIDALCEELKRYVRMSQEELLAFKLEQRKYVVERFDLDKCAKQVVSLFLNKC